MKLPNEVAKLNILAVSIIIAPSYFCPNSEAIQTALRLQSEGKSSLHHELKLKRRDQREHSQRERSRSSCSSRSSQSDDSTVQDTEKLEKGKERQDVEIESIIQVR